LSGKKLNIDLLKLLPISSSLEAAHFFTELLPTTQFNILFSKLGMQNIYSQLEEG